MKSTASRTKPSALFEAVVRREVTRVQELLANGVSPDEEDGPSGGRPLLAAASAGHVELTRLLLDAGAHVKVTDRNCGTALSKAVYAYTDDEPQRGRQVIDLLLAHGADPEQKNLHGVSPNSLAATIADTNVKEVLARAIQEASRKSRPAT